VTIPLQSKYDMENFYKQLDAMRSDAYNPYGSSTWSQTETFDQAGYDQAMGDWTSQYGPKPAETSSGGGLPIYGGLPVWEGSVDEGGMPTGVAPPAAPDAPPAPNRASFTSRAYDNTVGFNPEMQGQFDTVQSKFQELMSGINPNQSVDLIDDAGGKYSADLADAIYRRTTRLSDTQMNEAQRSLEQRLAERGFQVGNEGYNTEMNRLGTQRSEHYSDAADRAQIQAAQQALAEAGFTNEARLAEFQGSNNLRAQLAQLLMGREQQLMAGLSGNPTQFQSPSLPGLDVLGAYNSKYQGEVDAYNAEQASSASMLNSLLGLGASFLAPGAGSALTAGLGSVGGTMLGGGLKAPTAGFWRT
jgi:hypothetical protein